MLLVQSGDSAKASSALQALATRVPCHDTGVVSLLCAASARGTTEKSASKGVRDHFAVKAILTGSFTLRLSFRSYSLVLYTGSSARTTTTPQSNPRKPLTNCRSYCTEQACYLTGAFNALG